MIEVKPNWETAPEWANYWAVDGDGRCYWYANAPKINDDEELWLTDDDDCLYEFDDNAYSQWKDSLEKRPSET